MATPHLTAPVLTEKQVAKFWWKVDRRQPDECWPWKRCLVRGYGCVKFTVGSGEVVSCRAHVVARWLATGEWPGGLLTLHRCDVRYCCNPAHLYLGTAAQNTQDMLSRKRHHYQAHPECIRRGEELTQSKLTAEGALEIRRLYAAGGITLQRLGEQFGVSKVCVHHVVIRRTWKHLP